MKTILQQTGSADIIVSYPTNSHIRPLGRRVLSWAFVWLVNHLTGLRLRYYNGLVIHRTELVRAHLPMTDSFAYQAEILTSMIRAGKSYVEVGAPISQRASGHSKALKLKNFIEVGKSLWRIARL